MSGQGFGSPDTRPSQIASGSSSSTPKAIGSLAKKQSDVTRQGTQKLKFVPTLPARRKKEVEVKQETSAPSVSTTQPSDRGRGRGRGRGDGKGAASRPATEMTASGPFAMGPAMAGTSARRATPRSNFTPIVPMGPAASSLGSGLSHSAAPSLKHEKDRETSVKTQADIEEEAYSDPDDGVEIVDMQNVRHMDWMAPESLLKEVETKKKKRVKIERIDLEKADVSKGKGKVAAAMDVDADGDEGGGDVDLANALDLSESEEEEEFEDLIEDFTFQADLEPDTNVRQERLYFFQFPSPFPTFVSASSAEEDILAEVIGSTTRPNSPAKKVSFAPDVKPPGPGSTPTSARTSAVPEPQQTQLSDVKLDGVIGQLEIYKSGAVKMRLGDDIVLDVTAATQPSFLQQAVHLDMENKRLSVLGEVNKRFVVSPDVENLLSAMEAADLAAQTVELDEGLIQMDAT